MPFGVVSGVAAGVDSGAAAEVDSGVAGGAAGVGVADGVASGLVDGADPGVAVGLPGDSGLGVLRGDAVAAGVVVGAGDGELAGCPPDGAAGCCSQPITKRMATLIATNENLFMPIYTDASPGGLFKARYEARRVLWRFARSRKTSSTRKIGLTENNESFTGQNRPATLQVIEVKCHCRAAVRANEDRITHLDVDLGHKQSLEHTPKIRCDFLHLDDQDFGYAVSDFVQIEKAFDGFRITGNNPDERGIGRILGIQGEDMNVVSVQEFHYFQQRSDLILEEDGELFDRRS